MQKVTLIGAGGKMGLRLTHNLAGSDYSVSYVEISPAGIEKLKDKGVKISEAEDCVPVSDMVILAVPDVALEKVSAGIIPIMKADAMVVTLDPAAALAGKLFSREDVSYFISHPCHPSIFNWEPDHEAMKDHFGGLKAKQAIVCALMKGTDDDYARGEQLARTFYAPVWRSHRITALQMGMLEPALVETLASTCVYVIREGLEEVIKKGVPPDAARDFLLGHLRIQMAVLFNELPGAVFSDAANKALQRGLKEFIKEDWKKVFETENIMEQIRAIT
ncbi:MAG TPA: phosphogluconate dehydrogenase C-terminal domain-containing protein [Bacteroidales bacterium]|nr:phosphogluconate dehydrogenase C-terminal domain-containing protein [Bacteroidales bacterium]HPF02499.1 phosphogluconate dehydrogenase C-terminal domain-containing protein [Bacteroidales bacterium]HPJ59053.1 phosphogluconate dehydrogenase C-terminal domain-containing protein [Bacteroidales bacterium]HPR13163.1 phosphogluconate dehydrogenase C-terminal domain-containing protein [Bacteroidales bacterium]